MKYVRIKNVKLGDILGKTLYIDDKILLRKGTRLTQSYIERLSKKGINYLCIEDENSDIIPNQAISDKTKQNAIRALKSTIANIKRGLLDFGSIIESADNVVTDILNNKKIIDNLSDLRNVDEYTFYHSINVSVLAVLLGIEMNLDKFSLKKIAIGAILHDIGKMFIPLDILNKPNKLTEAEYKTVQKHCYDGYQILRSQYEIPTASSIIAYEHHERYNGTGYPNKLKGDKIHLFAQLTGISDIYDALTSDRIYKKAVSPAKAYYYLTDLSKNLFSKNIVTTFAKVVPPYPTGTYVILNNEKKGIVSKQNKNCIERPIIRIKDKEIDLSKHRDITITELFE